MSFWLDPLVSACWSWAPLIDAVAVLVNYLPEDEDLPAELRQAIDRNGERANDRHVWQLCPGITWLSSPSMSRRRSLDARRGGPEPS